MTDDLEKKHKDKETQSTQNYEIDSLIDRLKNEPCPNINDHDLEIENVKNKLKECKDELNTDDLVELDKCVCKKLQKDRIQKNAGIVT